jgi:hypothetical protein
MHHAQHGGREQRLHDGRIEQLAPQQQRQQREAELAALATTTPVRSDLNQLLVAGFRDHGDHRRLEQQHADQNRAHQRQVRSSSGTSSSMPTVMKNRPSSTSRYERMVASI